MVDTTTVQVQANSSSVTIGVTVSDDQNGNIQVSATATKSNLSVSVTLLPIHIGVATVTNGLTAGNWSDVTHWTPGNILANAAIALSETLSDATADSNPIVLGIESGLDLVKSFTAGPSNPTTGLTLPITFLAGLILDYQNASGVIQHFDNVDSPSANYGYKIPVTITVTVPVLLDIELTSGSTTTINQMNVVVGSLLLDSGSTLFTGVPSSSTGISVTGGINNNGALYVSPTGPVSVGGTFSNQANLYLEGALSVSGSLNNSDLIIVDAKNASLSGQVSNYPGQLSIYSDGSLNLSGFITGGSISIASGGSLEVSSGGGVAQATITAASGATVQLDGNSIFQFATLTGTGTFRSGFVQYDGISSGGFYGSALVNVTVSTGTTYDVSGAGTALGGTITNNGTLSGSGAFFITGPVTLKGGGQVTLGGSGGSYGSINALGSAVPSTPLTGRAAGADLLTNVDNTITGSYGAINVNLVNQASGTIGASLATGYESLSLTGTVTNQGLIQATAGGTLQLTGTVTNTGTLQASGNTTQGTGVLKINGTVENDGTVQANQGGEVEVSGTVTDTGSTLQATNGGLIQIDNSGLVIGSGVLSGSVTNNGLIEANNGILTVAGVASGNLKIGANSALDLSGGQSLGTVTFSSDSTLEIESSVSSSSLILTNFYSGDKIDLKNLIFIDGTTSGTYSSNSGQLQVSDGPQSVTLSFGVGNTTVDDPFHVTSDGSGGTLVTNDAAPVACYARGTRILTVRGEVTVETLQVGDLVATFAGKGAPLKPIRWMGYRRIDLREHLDPENTHPIRFRAGAIGEGCPYRDLVVSPGHRMRVDDVLVTALELVNGASIVQESPDGIEYWHVELDGHDLVLAAGMQAETYQDIGNRSAFENGGTVVALNPVLDGDVPEPCLPYAGANSAVRARLIARAEAMGWTRSIDPAPWLEVDGQRIEPTQHGQRCRFTLPEGFLSVQLRSRNGRPWDVDPHSGDRRQLGLKLYRLALDVQGGLREITLASPDPGCGFHEIEHDAEGRNCRWTTGNTQLDLANLMPGETVTALEIAYDQALPMWIGPEAACTGKEGPQNLLISAIPVVTQRPHPSVARRGD